MRPFFDTIKTRIRSGIRRGLRAENLWFALPALVAVILVGIALWQASSFREWLQAVQAILTSLALFVGGWWFLLRRRHYPRAEIQHSFSRVDTETGPVLLVQVKITNKGDLKIDLSEGQYELRRVPAGEIPLAAGAIFEEDRREVEGGEFDEAWLELPLDAALKAVAFYTCIKNPYRDDGTHWDKRSYYFLSDGKSLG